MAKYHIKADGSPGKCNAQKGNCPVGENAPHFESIEAAQQFADLKNRIEVEDDFSLSWNKIYSLNKQEADSLVNSIDKVVGEIDNEIQAVESEMRKLTMTEEWFDYKDSEEDFEEADDLDNIERDEQEDAEEEIEDDEDSEDDLEEDVPVVEDNKQNKEEYEVHPDAVEVEQEDKFDYTNPTELIGKWAEIFKEATCPECSSDLEICNDGEDKVDIICKSCSSKFYVDKNSGKIYKIK